MKKVIIIDKKYGSIDVDNLYKLKKKYQEVGIHLKLEHLNSKSEIVKKCFNAEAILCLGNPMLTNEVLKNLPNLKIIQRFGVGVNSIDLEAATRHKVIVFNMSGYCADEFATHVTSLILGLLRNTTYYDRQIRKGNWHTIESSDPKAVSDLTLGLFGFGNSAKALYKIFKNGFNTRIITYEPNMNPEKVEDFDVEIVDFDTLLRTSDILSLHAPLNKNTKHIIDYEALKKMKSQAMLINAARGELVNQNDLVNALQNNFIRSAGLDVFEEEPLLNDSPLIKMDNVMLSNHSAFRGENSIEKQLDLAFNLINDAINNNKLNSKYIVNKNVLYFYD